MLLKIKDKAPIISIPDESGKIFSWKDYEGKKVALFFYPKDNTPGCTQEACNLRDNYTILKNAGIEVVGISVDTERKHSNFINKYSLPFRLLADVEHKVVNDYGVWGEKKLFGVKYMGIFRTTFLVNEKQIIIGIIDKVETGNHANQILEIFKSI